jgi:hypothetical protein
LILKILTDGSTAKTAWNQLKFDTETQARARLDFSNKIAKQVSDPITSFKNEQKKMRKNVRFNQRE